MAVSSQADTCRRATLCWGVLPVEVDLDDVEDKPALSRQLVDRLDLASAGDAILLVQDFHALPERATPTITLLTV
jgi:pyruvate kinase